MNSVYIATSMDGFIADENGGIDFLETVAIPPDTDMGFEAFMSRMDALVMGRVTFETVCGFDVPWPYTKPVFVVSNTLKEIPNEYREKASLISGNPKEIVRQLNDLGFQNLYIDGGRTIQSFLAEDLIDELIITTIPVVLGGGHSLFGQLDKMQEFECASVEHFIGKLDIRRFVRKRKLSNNT